MNMVKNVLNRQVFPAMGCTEPLSVALCAAYASELLGEAVTRGSFTVDAQTFKNGMGVTLPNTGGERGNLLAAALGMLRGRPVEGMQILSEVNGELVTRAKELINAGAVTMRVDPLQKGFYVRSEIAGKKDRAVCVISKSHTEVTLLEKNGKRLIDKESVSSSTSAGEPGYAILLEKCSIKELVQMAEEADANDLAYVQRGIEMNLKASECGMGLKKVGYYLRSLKKHGFLRDDVFTSTKILVANATDARMDGSPLPVMTSGESGNQGIVAVLVPYNFGRVFEIPEEVVARSIILSHLFERLCQTFHRRTVAHLWMRHCGGSGGGGGRRLPSQGPR